MGHEKIPIPTEAEKQQAIARILDAGLPRRTALDRELWEVLQCVGPRALLFGVGDCLALSLLIWALCLLPALFVASSVGTLAPALFLFSPLLYATLSLLCQRLRGPAGWLAAPVCAASAGARCKEASPMLSVEHVTKNYGRFTALGDISLTFTPGVYGLLAPNGAGKTTLIKMLTTLLFPTKGQILWEGEDIQVLGAEYRGLLGYLLQQFGYYPNYTSRQFLRYAAALQCIPRREGDGRIEALLETVGLGDVADEKMKKFSGGMPQRVGIAVAMLNDPKQLILDEPTAGLAPRERVRFRNLIHALSGERIVILSTHIVSDIETIAGQIVMFRDHRLYCCDSPARICAQFQGRVFQLPAGTALAPGQFLLSEGQGEDGLVLRVLCDTPPIGGAMVTSGLEDAFLAIYREGQP